MPLNNKFSSPEIYDLNPFRDNIRFLKKSNHINSKQLAAMTGLGQATISKLLRTDRNPDLITTWRIADAFGVTIDWLVGRTSKVLSTPEEAAIEFAKRYTYATEADRHIIDMILDKYNDAV